MIVVALNTISSGAVCVGSVTLHVGAADFDAVAVGVVVLGAAAVGVVVLGANNVGVVGLVAAAVSALALSPFAALKLCTPTDIVLET